MHAAISFDVPQILVFLGSLAAVCGLVWSLFERAEAVVNEDTKKAISAWLRNIDVERYVAPWPRIFARVFDALFDARPLSRRRIIGSVVVSFCSVIVVVAFWSAFRMDDVLYYLRVLSWTKPWGVLGGMLQHLPVFIVVNVLTDYVSLAKGRWLISRIKTSSLLSICTWWLLDIALSILTCIIGLAIAITFVIVLLSIGQSGWEWRDVLRFIGMSMQDAMLRGPLFDIGGREDDDETLAWGVFIYASFFTVMWAWLYAVCGLLLRGAVTFQARLSSARKILDIERAPLRAMGFVGMLIVIVVYCVITVVR